MVPLSVLQVGFPSTFSTVQLELSGLWAMRHTLSRYLVTDMGHDHGVPGNSAGSPSHLCWFWKSHLNQANAVHPSLSARVTNSYRPG